MIARRIERRLRWGLFIAGAVLIWSLAVSEWQLLFCVFWGLLTLEAWGDRRLPALFFHSVSDNGECIGCPSLVMPVKSFDVQIKWLTRLGYHGLFCDECYQLRCQKQVPGNAICLTFDDGYLDNWTHAFPILKRYSMKATIFMAAGWIDNNPSLNTQMPTFGPSRDKSRGYLGPAEIRALQTSGCIDIQSHGLSHDSIFVSDEILGFVSPDNQPHGLHCYVHPEIKPHWFEFSMAALFGFPVFKTGEALADRAFIPDPALLSILREQAAAAGFFDQSDWESRLRETAETFKRHHGRLGRLETLAESQDRWRKELLQSREQLEAITGKPVRHLAWPRNAYNQETEKMALALGYQSTTTVRGLHNTYRQPHRLERLAVVPTGHTALDVARMLLEIWVFKGHYILWPLLFGLQRLSGYHTSKKK